MSRGVMLAMILNLSWSMGAAAGPPGPVYQGDAQAVAEVQAVTQRFLAATTWRVRITPPGERAQTMEYVAPNRFHMLMPSPGSQQSEMFMIGDDVWARTGGSCQKMPVAVPFANPREAMEHRGSGKITVTRDGPGTVEGTPAQTYLVTTVDTQGVQVQQKLFVATATGLPRRIEVRSDRGTTVIDYLDYGAPIAINNPPC